MRFQGLAGDTTRQVFVRRRCRKRRDFSIQSAGGGDKKADNIVPEIVFSGISGTKPR